MFFSDLKNIQSQEKSYGTKKIGLFKNQWNPQKKCTLMINLKKPSKGNH